MTIDHLPFFYFLSNHLRPVNSFTSFQAEAREDSRARSLLPYRATTQTEKTQCNILKNEN
jgi:hypothetical protein